MSVTPFNSGSRHRNDDGNWPVLARLPEVSQRSAMQEASRERAAAAGFVSYRLDAPHHTAADNNVASSRVNHVTNRADHFFDIHTQQGPTEPHIVQRGYYGAGPYESPILPRSNPFAIPASSLRETFVPVRRFLILFAVFTFVGTTALRWSQQAADTSVTEPGKSATHPALEPSVLTNDVELGEPRKAPTAAGPLGNNVPQTGARPKEQRGTAIGPLSAASQNLTVPPLAEETQSALPGPPPALARLPGYILPAPTKQAQHDDNQSSLY